MQDFSQNSLRLFFQADLASIYRDTIYWSAVDKGVYFSLLAHECHYGSLPDKISLLSRIAGVDPGTMKRFWTKYKNKLFAQNPDGSWESLRLKEQKEGEHDPRH